MDICFVYSLTLHRTKNVEFLTWRYISRQRSVLIIDRLSKRNITLYTCRPSVFKFDNWQHQCTVWRIAIWSLHTALHAFNKFPKFMNPDHSTNDLRTIVNFIFFNSAYRLHNIWLKAIKTQMLGIAEGDRERENRNIA